MITNYAVIQDDNLQELVNSVTRQCHDGWQTTGGIAMVREPGAPGKTAKVIYAQAMVATGPAAPNGRALLVPEKQVVAR